MPVPAIEVRGVSLRLGEFAVQDAHVSVAEGEYFVLLGPTGAGKTVLLECVAGLHRPERGEVRVSGEAVNDVAPERRGLGYLPQDYALFPHLSVARNIGFGMRLRRRPRREVERKVRELAELLRITYLLHRSPAKLSGGEQQRVALARALAIEPNVLLLDEPLSALDEQTREGLCGELRRVHEELGTTTMHVSHNFEETLAVADKIGVIHQGRIRQVGTPEEVFRHPNSEFVARFVRCDNVLGGTARRVEGGLRVRVGTLEFEAAEGPEGEVFLAVRPEEVELVRPGDGNGPNRVAGRIVGVVDKGALMKVEVALEDDARVGLMALVGRRAFQESGMGVGDEGEVFFASSSAHVFARE
ncbi:MAG: ABC transporter ATP-binding protein [Armatimonadota bacterium]|nr:MAG: ABC transporter ATP-binding protein [Armatimonadota bacterium]